MSVFEGFSWLRLVVAVLFGTTLFAGLWGVGKILVRWFGEPISITGGAIIEKGFIPAHKEIRLKLIPVGLGMQQTIPMLQQIPDIFRFKIQTCGQINYVEVSPELYAAATIGDFYSDAEKKLIFCLPGDNNAQSDACVG